MKGCGSMLTHHPENKQRLSMQAFGDLFVFTLAFSRHAMHFAEEQAGGLLSSQLWRSHL